MCKTNHSTERIKQLQEYSNASRYLEIGVRRGTTFFHVNIPFKAAVDPVFLFDLESHKKIGTYFFKETSDTFFTSLKKPGHPLAENFVKNGILYFDIIFLDGLHTFEQTFRDFKNSLAHAHEKTLWLIDDTVPSDAYSSLPDHENSLQLRKKSGIAGKQWHGDVFKVIFAIHDKYPEYSYCTLMEANPQTVVWKSGHKVRKPIFTSDEEIMKLGYFDMLNHAELLMPVEEARLASLLGTTVDPKIDAPADSRERLFYCPLISLKEERFSRSRLVRFISHFLKE